MAASGGSDSDKNKELAVKDEKSDGGGGGSGAAAAAANGGGGGGGGATLTGTPASTGVAKERDYIWSEDAVHVLLDHFLEKYMSYEKGMIRNADWVEIAARVNTQLDANKPLKTPEQCKNKVDNLKKQYRKERRRGSLGPSSTNWSFFSRMHDIFESDYKKVGGSTSAPAPDLHEDDEPPPIPVSVTPVAVSVKPRLPPPSGGGGGGAGVVPDHYMASREFAKRYSPPPPPVPAVQPTPLMLLPEPHRDHHHHHHPRDHHHEAAAPARKKAKASSSQPAAAPPPPPPQFDQGSGAPSSDSGGAAGGGGGSHHERSSKMERKLQRHQLAALRRDFMEGFTGFAEVMLKIEVAKMEMQRDLERQRAEMELHRTQMMLSNQLQLAKYLKSSPLAAAAAGAAAEAVAAGAAPSFWPNFGFADNGTGPVAGPGVVSGVGPAVGPGVGVGPSSGNRLQLAIPIFPGFTALDAVGPYEVLHLLPNVDVLFVSHEPGLYAAGMGMLTLQATASFDQVPRPQILVVPGGTGTRRLLQDRPILDWIKKVHEHTLFTASVCTGSLLLGAAGLLRGVEATTHWNSHEKLAEFGAKPVSSRIVRQGKIITAAGVSAGIDMALQLAALLTDEATAKMLQLYIEYDPQPPFDTGSVSKAGPELTNRAKELSKLRQAAA